MSTASGRSDLRPTNLAAAPHIHFEFVLGSKIGDLVASFDIVLDASLWLALRACRTAISRFQGSSETSRRGNERRTLVDYLVLG